MWGEAAGLYGVDLRWGTPHQPAAGYQVALNGTIVGYSITQTFALRGLDPNREYEAEVRTVWQDGRLSEKSAKLKFSPRQLLPHEIQLSVLQPLSITHGWRQPEMNRAFTGKGLSIAGKHYPKGIGMPTNSEIEFEIEGVYETFSAAVGVDDEFNSADGSVEFVLEGDGKELWRSKPLKKVDGATPVKVSVKGIQKLKLLVRRPEGQSGRAHADWVDAKLSGPHG
jgi:endo-alpha-N-acetylgalactosaminidase